jgi:putative ABC transport system substrate-binding protein
MERRALVALAGAILVAPQFLSAQTAKRVYRIAILEDSVESARDHLWRAFRDRLRELVVVDGNDVAYETRYARGALERLPKLAQELVALKPDAIVCIGSGTASAAMKATSSIPIVFIAAGDPIGTGLVASLAHPGGNATGTSNLTTDTAAKQLELLREMSPGAKRLALLTYTSNKGSVAVFRNVEAHAHAVKIAIRMFDGSNRANLDRSLEIIKRERIQGLIVGANGVLLEHRDQIVKFAAREKLPTVYGRREYVDAGGLLSYGADHRPLYRRGAEHVHQILRGEKPADIPVEQTTTVQLVLNLKTAQEQGIKVPESVRLRADEVIQ